MNTNERQALRINILLQVCKKTSYSTNTEVNPNEIYEQLRDYETEALNDAALYLYDKGYITGSIINYQGQRVIKNIKPTLHGIDFVEKMETNQTESIQNKDFAESAIQLVIGSITNSNIVTGSSHVQINQSIGLENELLENVITELSKGHAEEVNKLLELLKISLESKKSDKGFIAGLISAIGSLNVSIAANLLTPAIKVWLGIS